MCLDSLSFQMSLAPAAPPSAWTWATLLGWVMNDMKDAQHGGQLTKIEPRLTKYSVAGVHKT